jgi:hypothetical protein
MPATLDAPPRTTKKTVSNEVIEIPCEFGQVSIGDGTCRIGVSVNRERMNLKQADHFFAGSRLMIDVVVDPNSEKDTAGQQVMEGVEGKHTKSTVDVKGFRVTTTHITTGLTFKREEIDLVDLADFANCNGKLKCQRIGDAETPARSGSVVAGWRKVKIETLIDDGKTLGVLDDLKLVNCGDVTDYLESDKKLPLTPKQLDTLTKAIRAERDDDQDTIKAD